MAYVIFHTCKRFVFGNKSCHYELVRFVHSLLSTFATDSRVCDACKSGRKGKKYTFMFILLVSTVAICHKLVKLQP